jgi:DNA-binding XRE family transcriptional regulator
VTDTQPLTRAQQWGLNVADARGEESQAALAKRVNTSQQTISRIELGQQVPSDALRVRIAKALERKTSELFNYEDGE